MKDIVKFAIWVICLIAVFKLASALLGPVVASALIVVLIVVLGYQIVKTASR